MKKLYKFRWDCGRNGDVEGTFIEEEEVVRAAIGNHVYFGEILGKHSEVQGTLEEGDLQVVDVSDGFIEEFERVMGCSGFGYNPLDYMLKELE